MTDTIYIYAKPNTMKEHTFNDDVAIVMAENKKEAIECFRKYYDLSNEDCKKYITRIRILKYREVHILTSY